MITKLARLEFELFTKPSNSDFLQVRQLLGTLFIGYSKQRTVTAADQVTIAQRL